jgi:hypothetical protein
MKPPGYDICLLKLRALGRFEAKALILFYINPSLRRKRFDFQEKYGILKTPHGPCEQSGASFENGRVAGRDFYKGGKARFPEPCGCTENALQPVRTKRGVF